VGLHVYRPRATSSLSDFSATVARADPEIRVILRGELDRVAAPELTRVLWAVEHDQPEPLLLGMAGVTFMDAGGLRVILEAARRAERAGRRLVVTNPTHTVRRLFELAAIDQSLELVPD
jgi:anti-anti-sigma factor